ncbi:methylsterol monooxygenase 1-2-like [Abrus precatorius]|uniref:Methylsterol monooxygenase 1-2-like n=1 Tax=Abrus precatorius TaxID=3816 RepID=A0A8B8K6A1_ABRPR|nr:methylsterol monooxygenase 1-2-like [Abrus precatorius]
MLPYKTIEEAEVALDRGLTLAETLWFKYTANKPDFVLHCHNILFLCLFYTLAPIPFALIELSGSKNFNKYKIQPLVKTSFWEMFKCYKKVMQTFIIAVGPLQILSYPTIKWIGIRTDLTLPSGWEIFCQLFVYFVIEDFSNYWIHRLLHCKWAFEKIHKVHHEYSAPVGLAAPYAHWAEIILLGIPSFLGPAIVPCHITTYWLWFVLRQLEAVETHSGYDFPWSPTKYIPFYAGAAYHDYHHYVGGRSQGNFASVFTYCDYIYGTDKGYQYTKQMRKNKSTSTMLAQNDKME